MQINKTIKYTLGIAVAAVVPLSFFFITRQFSDGKIKVPPYYGEIVETVRNGKAVKDTIYPTVKELTLTNQLGQKVSLNKDLKGKVLVIDFIFTSCPTVCPRLSTNMKELQKAYIKKNPELVQFISITVDPKNDTVEALRAYADRYEADHDRWWFLTGDSKTIFDYAQNELGLTLQPSDGSDGFDHSDQMVLIDSARHIRGFFNGMDKAETKKIADDIYILSVEKGKNKQLARTLLHRHKDSPHSETK